MQINGPVATLVPICAISKPIVNIQCQLKSNNLYKSYTGNQGQTHSQQKGGEIFKRLWFILQFIYKQEC